MSTRRLLLDTIVASTFAALAPSAQAAVDLYVNIAPPVERYEVIPEPRAGYVWAPGYWDWRGNHHIWVRGHRERQRVGYFYHSPRWTEREGRWHIERGRWDRNRPEGDRDHDGVPNWRDREPDNPRRQ